MARIRILRLSALSLALALHAASSLPGNARAAHAADAPAKAESVRAEVAKPLLAAQELVRQQKYREALARIDEADRAQEKTPYESFLVDRLRGPVAAATGDTDLAIKSLEAALASGRLSGGEQLQVLQGLAGTCYQAGKHVAAASWAERYVQAGGADASVRSLLSQSLYLAGDYAAASKALQAELQADEAAQRTLPEERLRMLASTYLKLNDEPAYIATLERLVMHYPRKDYWDDILSRLPRKPGFSPRLRLPLYRLRQATGTLSAAGQYVEMAELSLQAGLPVEARKVMDMGYAAGVLGSGPDAERHRRLRELSDRKAAEDRKSAAAEEASAAAARNGNAALNTGFNMALDGRYDRGLALMESGLDKGGVSNIDEARLKLAQSYAAAGRRSRAEEVLREVRGSDGTADLARLWLLHLARNAS